VIPIDTIIEKFDARVTKATEATLTQNHLTFFGQRQGLYLLKYQF